MLKERPLRTVRGVGVLFGFRSSGFFRESGFKLSNATELFNNLTFAKSEIVEWVVASDNLISTRG